MWKFLCIPVILFFLSFGMFAQETEDYKEKYYTPEASNFELFIQQAYGDRAEDLVFNNEIRMLLLKDFFVNRLEIVDRNPEEEIPQSFLQLTSIGELGYVAAPAVAQPFNPKNFNPFYYKIDFTNTKTIQHIHISGTHFYLKVKPFSPEVINQLRQE